jgi:hypothetical protein
MRPVNRDIALTEHVIEPAACVGLSSEILALARITGYAVAIVIRKRDL